MTPFVAVTPVLPGFPLVYRTRHQEIDPPYRASPRALVVRVLRRRALVFGWWRRTGLDEDGAFAALGLRGHGTFKVLDLEDDDEDEALGVAG